MVLTFYGSIRGQDLVDALVALVDDARFSPQLPRLWDVQHIRQFVVDLEELETLRRLLDEQYPALQEGRAAVVVHPARENDGLIFELLRWQIKGKPLQVFTDIAEALAWLRAR